jgi:tetratricopeptide (TPR) repeat protein
MQGKFADNPYYLEYEASLKKLHQMLGRGEGDSDEADALRDEMDRSASELSHEEMKRLKGLSADLYMLQDDEIYAPIEPGEDRSARDVEHLQAAVTEAWARRDVVATLELLRKGPTRLTPDQLAYIRARAYEELGHLDTALLFMFYAAERNPEDSNYKWMVLNLLDRPEQRSELYQRASEYIQDAASSAELRVYAVGLLFRLTRRMTREQAATVFALVIDSLESALPLLESGSRLILPDLPAYGQLTLGFCYQRSGRLEDALNAFDQAMRSPQIRDAALVARGMLLLAMSNPEKALADFEKAIASNTPLVAPYLHLAHHALIQGDYVSCLELCDRALDRTRNPRLQAVVLQWEAIAGAELGAPLGQVHRAFEVALTRDPLNPQIRHNFELFQQMARPDSTTVRSQAPWQLPDTPDLEGTELILPAIPVVA